MQLLQGVEDHMHISNYTQNNRHLSWDYNREKENRIAIEFRKLRFRKVSILKFITKSTLFINMRFSLLEKN